MKTASLMIGKLQAEGQPFHEVLWLTSWSVFPRRAVAGPQSGCGQRLVAACGPGTQQAALPILGGGKAPAKEASPNYELHRFTTPWTQTGTMFLLEGEGGSVSSLPCLVWIAAWQWFPSLWATPVPAFLLASILGADVSSDGAPNCPCV